MNIVIIDAQGGGLGRLLVSAVRERFAAALSDSGWDERRGDGRDV